MTTDPTARIATELRASYHALASGRAVLHPEQWRRVQLAINAAADLLTTQQTAREHSATVPLPKRFDVLMRQEAGVPYDHPITARARDQFVSGIVLTYLERFDAAHGSDLAPEMKALIIAAADPAEDWKPLPASGVDGGALGSPELPPSLRASLDLYREDPQAWHAEWTRKHEYGVRLIKRAEAAEAEVETLRRERDEARADVAKLLDETRLLREKITLCIRDSEQSAERLAAAESARLTLQAQAQKTIAALRRCTLYGAADVAREALDQLAALLPAPVEGNSTEPEGNFSRPMTRPQSPDERLAKQLQWALDNIYTIARRELLRLERAGASEIESVSGDRWGHILRLCEQAGCQSRGVLRDNGGSFGQPLSADAVDPHATDPGTLTTRDKASSCSSHSLLPAPEGTPERTETE